MTQWEKYIEYLKKWVEEHSGKEYAGMSPVCFDEWEDNEDVAKDESRKIICKVTWRIQDIIDAFRDEYGREPIQNEIDAIYENYKAEECEDGSIGYGWEYITNAIEETMPINEEEED